MAILKNGTKVFATIEYIERTGTVVSSALYGPEGLKYTVNLDEAVPYGWNLHPTTEFIVEEKFVKEI